MLTMCLIFIFSSQPAAQSNKLSKQVTEIIVHIAEKAGIIDNGVGTTEELVGKFNHMVRKYAHGLVYFFLGILTAKALRFSGARKFSVFILPLAICITFAVFDETHQLFVPGRGGQVSDIIIDSVGAITGILVYLLLASGANPKL